MSDNPQRYPQSRRTAGGAGLRLHLRRGDGDGARTLVPGRIRPAQPQYRHVAGAGRDRAHRGRDRRRAPAAGQRETGSPHRTARNGARDRADPRRGRREPCAAPAQPALPSRDTDRRTSPAAAERLRDIAWTMRACGVELASVGADRAMAETILAAPRCAIAATTRAEAQRGAAISRASHRPDARQPSRGRERRRVEPAADAAQPAANAADRDAAAGDHGGSDDRRRDARGRRTGTAEAVPASSPAPTMPPSEGTEPAACEIAEQPMVDDAGLPVPTAPSHRRSRLARGRAGHGRADRPTCRAGTNRRQRSTVGPDDDATAAQDARSIRAVERTDAGEPQALADAGRGADSPGCERRADGGRALLTGRSDAASEPRRSRSPLRAGRAMLTPEPAAAPEEP